MKIIKNNSAFTLIEILIVIAIILIVGALVVPGIIKFQSYQVEDTVVSNFVSSIRTYQNIAMTKDIKTSVKREINKISFCEFTLTEDGTQSAENCTKYLDLTDSTANLWPPNSSGEVFYFDKYGNTVDNSGNQIDKVINSLNFKIEITKNGSITKSKIN